MRAIRLALMSVKPAVHRRRRPTWNQLYPIGAGRHLLNVGFLTLACGEMVHTPALAPAPIGAAASDSKAAAWQR